MCVYIHICSHAHNILFIYLWRDTWAAFICWLLWITLLWILGYKYLLESWFALLWVCIQKWNWWIIWKLTINFYKKWGHLKDTTGREQVVKPAFYLAWMQEHIGTHHSHPKVHCWFYFQWEYPFTQPTVSWMPFMHQSLGVTKAETILLSWSLPSFRKDILHKP